GLDVTITQLEVIDEEVLPDAGRCHGLRDYRSTAREVPAQHDLRRGSPITARDSPDRGIIKQAPALAQRAPGLHLNPVLHAELTQLVSRESRVQLDLIDSWHDAGPGKQPLQVSDLEIGDSDGANEPFGMDAFER